MILRIFRARAKPGMQSRFARLCREKSLPYMQSMPGLVYFHIGRSMPQRPHEFVLVSAWKDMESLKALAGENWETPVILPGEGELVEDISVQHYVQEDDSTVRGLGQAWRIPAEVLQAQEDVVVRSLRLRDEQWERVQPL